MVLSLGTGPFRQASAKMTHFAPGYAQAPHGIRLHGAHR